jgi:LeuA allosteric (dimerisation) domain
MTTRPIQPQRPVSGADPRTGAGGRAPVLHLARWTVSSGSQVQSRGAVVIASGDHQWEAAAEGNGPVDALLRAVDRALSGVLTGHPRLIAYDVHAVAEGPDSEGVVTIKIAPPSSAAGRRASGTYTGTSANVNIIAASIEAYVDALNLLLGEAHWAGATEAAGNRKRVKAEAAGREPRAELDEDAGHHDTTAWFER